MIAWCYDINSHTQSSSLSQELLANVVENVNSLSKDFEHLRSIVAHPQDPVTATQTDVYGYEPITLVGPTSVTNTNEIIVETKIHETPQNMSINSIEEFLSSPDYEIPLNYRS